MREIKFRAWYPKEKKMIPDIQNEYDGRYEFCFGHFLRNEDYEIMQYTGLKDKNGKEIYEGDVIKEENGEVSLVEYNYWGCPTVQGLEFHFLAEPDTKLLCEVIGNMYEDQKLLPTPPYE